MKKTITAHHILRSAVLLPTAALGVGLSAPMVAFASAADPSEIVVTAQRTEDVIQNIPISMTVFNQEMLSERNVTSGADLVNFTPSLNVNNRFGSDQASFSIRGFTQELRTTASVAVYFADVVAPRASGSVTAGDGAGPGAFFDLQNVQVLKGPQGTLFGRNTTGGAILLVPQEPTSKLEGSLEASRGNYDMSRVQGILNVPISDTLRARVGLDTQRRDGYLVNTTGVGPDNLANVDYISARAGLIWELTDAIENYTVFTQTTSKNNGNIEKMFVCDPHPDPANAGANFFAGMCQQSLAKQGDGFYSVSNGDTPDLLSRLRIRQLINTTSWNIADDLSAKNIFSYAHLDQDMRGPVAGSNFYFGSKPLTYFASWQLPGVHTSDQNTMVEELRLNGSAASDKLIWQAGYYYEDSRPGDWSGSQSPSLMSCDQRSLGWDSASWNCENPTGAGIVLRQLAKMEYNNQALYAQGTYDINDEFRATLGLRYTIDHTAASLQSTIYSNGTGTKFPKATECTQPGAVLSSDCLSRTSTKSEAPTWLIGLDYLPTADVLTYVKYARGYRQGSIVTAAPAGYQTYDPEQVNAYEIGAKTSFRGPIPGTFNVALFYNELKDQQLQLGLGPNAQAQTKGTYTSAIVNAGSSTIQGAEVETTLKLLDGLTFNLGYTYLDTHLDSLNYPAIPGWDSYPTAIEGGHLPLSPRHTVVTGLSYELPLPAEVGQVSAGATYTFTSSQSSAATGSPYAELSARQLLNLNIGWKAIYNSPFDAAFFMTNALNEKYYTYSPGLYNSTGTDYGVTGEPKMWGVRVKYNF